MRGVGVMRGGVFVLLKGGVVFFNGGNEVVLGGAGKSS